MASFSERAVVRTSGVGRGLGQRWAWASISVRGEGAGQSSLGALMTAGGEWGRNSAMGPAWVLGLSHHRSAVLLGRVCPCRRWPGFPIGPGQWVDASWSGSERRCCCPARPGGAREVRSHLSLTTVTPRVLTAKALMSRARDSKRVQEGGGPSRHWVQPGCWMPVET